MHHQGGNVAIRKWTVFASLALCAALALTVVSAGSAKPSKAQATSGLKVALVTDIGGLNDRSFNALAYKGLKNAEKKLGINGRVFLSKSSADYIPNLSTGARSYDLVIGVGFLMADQMAAVAKRFPDTKFAIVDYPAAALKGEPKNARGILFAEQEAGCLAGVAAATVSKSGVIGSVGGQKIPPVDAYIAGYQFCAKKVKPNITTAERLLAGLRRQAKCKEIALNQIQQRSDVVFQVAGRCGLGALQAAKDNKDWGIGVDADQWLPRQAHAHERPEEGRRGRVRHDRARRHGQVEGRGRRPLQREERRRRLRQGELGGARTRSPDRDAQRLDEAARGRQDQAPAHRHSYGDEDSMRFSGGSAALDVRRRPAVPAAT